MIAMVSSAARDSRMRRLPRSMRPTHSACSEVVTTIQPPAISRSSTPASRSVYWRPRWWSPSTISSALDSSASLRSAIGNGWSDENSSASIAGSSRLGGMAPLSLLGAGDDRHLAEDFVLLDGRGSELDDLEQRNEG